MNNRDIIVMGASIGGLEYFKSLVSRLDPELPAAIFIVQHITPKSSSLLDDILGQAGPMKAEFAGNGQEFQKSRIYIAPPDYHMILKDRRIYLTRGPKENHTRPSIDVLFRSAAVEGRSRVIGVLLSGMLDDGTVGLSAIKRCGGITVVQEPDEAPYPDMPRNALESGVKIDHRVSVDVDIMAELLNELVRNTAPDPPEIPRDLKVEARIAERFADHSEALKPLVSYPSQLICPECGGVLHEFNDEATNHYRCDLGHAYTDKTLLLRQDKQVELALITAYRVLKDRAKVYGRMGKEIRPRNPDSADRYETRSKESLKMADIIAEAMVPLPTEQSERGMVAALDVSRRKENSGKSEDD